uniref:Uncharacterized protein n=1 Tax=Ditylenchus dipsaci TaxID=166011 RepID=A0A915DBS9_9BILA
MTLQSFASPALCFPRRPSRSQCLNLFRPLTLINLLVLLIVIILQVIPVTAHFCGNNRIPYGIEIYRNGQPSLLCSRPSCFEKTYAECDERAMKSHVTLTPAGSEALINPMETTNHCTYSAASLSPLHYSQSHSTPMWS